MEQDEIYLADLWRIFAREWKWFVLVLVLTLACTYAFAHLVKRQWEAIVWIQIGQVGAVPSGQDPKVEPLQRVLERLQLVPFENEVLRGAGYAPDSSVASLYRKSVKLDPLPYAGPLIRLSVRSYSRQQASELATATVTRLRAIHQPLQAVQLASARARLAAIERDLRIAQAEHSRYLEAAQPGSQRGPAGKDAANPMLASLLLANKEEEIRGLQQARNDLAERLGPTYTYETSTIWPVYVPEHQAFPNPALTWGIGLLLGIFLGSSATLARNVARRR
ncbi:Wzz/FepE/Etk N-terminal domain-containing protein [Frateuria sp.]|uniref:Wzz/FepE/Etk N-terminal domain-containing protein n=1 Tax=Frateuria sp. TaxID=2211372 RepID=UPI001790F35E|nr:Wzz/FepE/Etk N-terminal domain-containing protein [Frateuria sp.]NUR21587.1 lipopolysaccharide biosynthesis protein [Frateuria sp.]